jgi:hypothetical protein
MSSDEQPARISPAQAAAIACLLDHWQMWLLHAGPGIAAGLARGSGEPAAPALSWARDLRADLRHYSSVLRQAAHAAGHDARPGQGDRPDE